MAKKHGIVIFWIFLVIFTFMIIAVSISYFYFEMNKLQMYGVTPFADIKSYTTSMVKMIPIVGNTVKYQPMKTISYQTLLESRIDAFQSVLDAKASSLDAKSIQIANLENKLSTVRASIDASQIALQDQIKQFNSQMAAYQSYKSRIQTLDQWITNSNPSQIGHVLANSDISVSVLVDAMTNLSPQVAGSILQSISQTNPTLASAIIENLTKVTK